MTATADSVCQTLDRATFKRLLGNMEDMMRKNMEVYNAYRDTVSASRSAVEAPAASDESDDEADHK